MLLFAFSDLVNYYIVSSPFALCGVFVIICFSKVKDILVKKFSKHHGSQFLLIVQEMVVTLVERLDANRAFVFEKHNGVKFANGKGMDKISMTYEKTDLKTKPIKAQSQDMPIHLFGNLIIDCEQKNYVIVNVSKIEDNELKGDMISKGIKTMVMCPYRKNVNQFTEGFVGVTFTDEEQAITEEQISIVQSFANTIGYELRK